MHTLEWINVGIEGGGAVALLSAALKKDKRLQRLGALALSAGLALGAVGFFSRVEPALREGSLPFSGPADSFFALSWALIASALLLHIRPRLTLLSGILAVGGAALAAGSRLLPGNPMAPVGPISEVVFGGHIFSLFIGMASLFVASVAGLLYLLARRELKSKRLSPLLSLMPPLETLDSLVLRSLVLGVIFLTIGLVTGIYLAHSVWTRDWTRDPKVIFSMITWGWYLFLLAIRTRVGWRGPRFFTLLVVGFCFLIFTFLGVSFFFHSSGTRWM